MIDTQTQDRMGRPIRSIAERFWEKVDRRRDDECWEWTGKRNQNGYGVFTIQRDRVATGCGAHRQSYELAYGPIPDGALVLHRCDNPPCVNPMHLFLGDQTVNMRDARIKGRLVRDPQPLTSHCGQGHEFTPENTYEWRGERHCRTCRDAIERRRVRPKKPAIVRTTCRKGHPLTPENAYMFRGARYCRPCRDICEAKRHRG